MDGTERRQLVMDYFTNKKFKINPDYVYKARDSDLIVVGPPKCGTTWMQQILHQIRTKGDESFDDIYGVTCWIPNPETQIDFNTNLEQVCNPRVFKHHEAFGVIDTTEKQKKIVIFRDPYDATYSWSKWFDRFYGYDADVEDSEMSAIMMSLHDTHVAGSFRCMATWWKHRQDPNVMFVFYEDFKKDLPCMIRKIAHFVGIPLTETELARVAEFCSFRYMSGENHKKFGGETVLRAMASSLGIDMWKPKCGLVRKEGGQIGEGVKIGPQSKATVDRLWAETMKQNFGFNSYQEMYNKCSHLICSKNEK